MKKLYKNKNLLIFLLGYFISGVGSRLTVIALSNKALRLTNSDFSINLVFMLQSVPILFLGIAAGNVIDRSNKKRSIILLNILFACTSMFFALSHNIWLIYAVIIINGVIMSFYTPARVSMMPLLVDETELAEANGLRVSVNGVVGILGYAAAGTLVGLAGDTFAFTLDSLSFLILTVLFLYLKPKGIKQQNASPSMKRYREEIKEGWEFIRHNRYIKKIFALNVLTSFIIYMQIPLTYLFVERHLGGKELMAQRTGYIFAFLGIGSVCGGIMLSKFKDKNRILLLSIALIIDSILLVGFAVNRYYPVTLIICTTWGVVGSFTGSLLETVIQEKTPAAFIGRVSGFNNSILEPTYIMSLLFGGIASKFFDPMFVFLFCALFEFVIGIYFTFTERASIIKQ